MASLFPLHENAPGDLAADGKFLPVMAEHEGTERDLFHAGDPAAFADPETDELGPDVVIDNFGNGDALTFFHFGKAHVTTP
jgi:hypothetical protein